MSEFFLKVSKAAEYVSAEIAARPSVGIILGSGLGGIAGEIQDRTELQYGDIPYFPKSTVPGHKGLLVTGRLEGKNVICMQGRVHFYEGYSMKQVAFPVYVMKMLGIRSLIVTNAAGGVNKSFAPGNLMLIRDHINLMGGNPLTGENDDRLGPRFPDMTKVYSEKLIKCALSAASDRGIAVKQGVYAAMSGPSFETPAEIRFLRTIGADAVGMSTVPEVIAAGHCGISVLGISCITNYAAGVTGKPLSHDEVIKITSDVSKIFKTLIKAIAGRV